VVAEKTRFMFFIHPKNHFQSIFHFKTHRKHHGNLAIHGLKKRKKNTSKPETKNLSELIFFRHFQDKKTRSLNSFYHIESFDIKIDHFSG
jgi:hypothetical protein